MRNAAMAKNWGNLGPKMKALYSADKPTIQNLLFSNRNFGCTDI